MVCKTLRVLSKTTQPAPPSPSTPGLRRALAKASVFPLAGGIAVGLWLENWGAGAAAYYALLLLAIASPEGQPLRASFARRPKR